MNDAGMPWGMPLLLGPLVGGVSLLPLGIVSLVERGL